MMSIGVTSLLISVSYFMVGIVLAIIGVIGLFGLFSETEKKMSLLWGSLLFIGVGAVLIVIDKIKTKCNKPLNSVNIPTPSSNPQVSTTPSAVPSSSPSVPTHKKKTVTIPEVINGQPLAYRYYDVDLCVIGGQEPDFGSILERFQRAEPIMISFELEPDNAYDKKAVKVMDGNNKLGYLYQGKMRDMVYDYIQKERPLFSFLSKFDDNTNKIQMFIGLYYSKSYSNSVTFKLTGSTKREAQDEIECCSVGDILTIEYDFEDEKYAFIRCDTIGFAPKSKNELLEVIEENCRATISEIETDENDKYHVVVKVEYD